MIKNIIIIIVFTYNYNNNKINKFNLYYYFSHSSPVIYVGFNQSSYTVEESNGVVEVCIDLKGKKQSYVLGKPVRARISTKEGSAEGHVLFKCSIH